MIYLQLMLPVAMWGMVGVLVKMASTMAGSGLVTFSRFFFGSLFLAGYLMVRDKRLSFHLRHRWIWLGMLGKSLNYITENIGIAKGVSYGNVLVLPVQAVVLALVAVTVFRESLTMKKAVALALCLGGVIMMTAFGSAGRGSGFTLVTVALFALSGVGASVHVLSQKLLVADMDAAKMNFSVFSLSGAFCAIPLPFTPATVGQWSFAASIALVSLGFITGVSFLVFANALKKVPLLHVTLAMNSSVLFTMAFSHVFLGDRIGLNAVLGALTFVVGIVMANLLQDAAVNRIVKASPGNN